jgi:hypothetical protein
MPKVSVTAGYYHQKFGNICVNDNLNLLPTEWTPFTIVGQPDRAEHALPPLSQSARRARRQDLPLRQGSGAGFRRYLQRAERGHVHQRRPDLWRQLVHADGDSHRLLAQRLREPRPVDGARWVITWRARFLVRLATLSSTSKHLCTDDWRHAAAMRPVRPPCPASFEIFR